MRQLFLNYPFFALLILIGLLSSCGPDFLYQKTVEIKSQNWTYDNPVQFGVEVRDTNILYNLFLSLKHSTDYPFENLYTKIKTQFPSGEIVEDVVSLELAGPGGIWLGDCSAKNCLLEIPIRKGAYFNQVGTYQFTIEQYMRQESIPHIHSFTLSIEDTGQSRTSN